MAVDCEFILRLIRTCSKTPNKRSTMIWRRLKKGRGTDIPRRKILRTRRAPPRNNPPIFRVGWLLLTIGLEQSAHLWAGVTIETVNSIAPFRPIAKSDLHLNPLSISRHSLAV